MAALRPLAVSSAVTFGHADRIVHQARRTSLGAVTVAILAACYLLSFRPFSRPVVLDPATWDYMSLALHDGYVPYRDIFLHKTPGAIFIGAAGATVARALGQSPILGVHAVFCAMGAFTPALTFLVCRRQGVRTFVAFAAAAWLLGVDQWSLAAIEGARPKVATTTLGLAGVLAVNRPLLSGVLCGAATLCWQPGLVFGLGALAEIYLRRPKAADRLHAIGWFCLGAALPSCGLLAYLGANNALRSFFADTFLFNLNYVELLARTPTDTFRHLWALCKQWNPIEVALLPPAIVGLLATRRSPPLGLSVATLAYTCLLFVSVQAWPDTILLAPGIATLLGLGLSALLEKGMPQWLAASIVSVGALVNLAAPGSNRFFPPISWDEQHEFMITLASDLSASDRVYVVSCPEFLIHTGRHSVLPWPYMWFGVDRFAAAHTPGGFERILRRLAEEDPKMMIVCRRWNGDLRRRFEEWARQRYERHPVRFYPHTKRPMMIYRRAPAQ